MTNLRNYLTGENLFLFLLALVSSLTTYLGLRESLQEGMLSAGSLSEFLSAALGLTVFGMIIWVWKFLQSLIAKGSFTATMIMLAVWMPTLFCTSTWWSIVGISGGTAIRYELSENEAAWRDQIDRVFADRAEQVQTSLSTVTTIKAQLQGLAAGEATGMITGFSGTGPVARCYQRMASGAGQLETVLTAKATALETGHQEMVTMVNEIAGSRQQDLPTRGLIAAYQAGGQRLQAALPSKAALGDLSSSVQATKALMACPPIEGLRPEQQQALTDVQTRIDSLTFTQEGEESQEFVLAETTPVHQAIFTQWEQIIPGWGVAAAIDMLPLFLLVGAYVGSERRRREAAGVERELETLQAEREQLLRGRQAELLAIEVDHSARLETIKKQIGQAETDRDVRLAAIERETAAKGAFSPEARQAMEGQVAGQRLVIEELRAEIRRLGGESNKHEDELARRADLGEVNRLLNAQAEERRHELAHLAGQVQVLTVRAEQAEAGCASLTAERVSLKGEIGSLQQANLELSRRVAGLEAGGEQNRLLIETLRGTNEATIEELRGVQAELDAEKAELETARETIAHLGEQIGHNEQLIAAIRGTNVRLLGQTRDLEAELALKVDVLHAANEAAGHLEAQVGVLSAARDAANARADEAEKRLGVIHAQFGTPTARASGTTP